MVMVWILNIAFCMQNAISFLKGFVNKYFILSKMVGVGKN